MRFYPILLGFLECFLLIRMPFVWSPKCPRAAWRIMSRRCWSAEQKVLRSQLDFCPLLFRTIESCHFNHSLWSHASSRPFSPELHNSVSFFSSNLLQQIFALLSAAHKSLFRFLVSKAPTRIFVFLWWFPVPRWRNQSSVWLTILPLQECLAALETDYATASLIFHYKIKIN